MFDQIRAQLSGLDTVELALGETSFISYILALIMFGVALNIHLSTFKKVFTNPKSIIVGLCMQWVALPAVTFALVWLLRGALTPMVALGMVLVACCPGGNISNFMSSLSKGNVELSVSMTAVSTITAPVITPFNFWIWGNLCLKVLPLQATGLTEVPELVIPFMDMFEQVLLLLGIPIVLGMLFAQYCPKVTEKIKKPFSVFSLLVFAAMVIVMFSSNWQQFVDYIIFIFIIVLIHNACALATGFLGGTLAKVPVQDRRSMTIEVGIQNSGLGLMLLLNPAIFPEVPWHDIYGGMLFVTAWWGIWHIISGLTVASLFRRSKID